jgi:hypothetical protein
MNGYQMYNTLIEQPLIGAGEGGKRSCRRRGPVSRVFSGTSKA